MNSFRLQWGFLDDVGSVAMTTAPFGICFCAREGPGPPDFLLIYSVSANQTLTFALCVYVKNVPPFIDDSNLQFFILHSLIISFLLPLRISPTLPAFRCLPMRSELGSTDGYLKLLLISILEEEFVLNLNEEIRTDF